jgi:RNA polymerase sigma factor (sigma-70 family)
MAQLELSHSSRISSGTQFPQPFDRADFAMYLKVVRRHPGMAWAKRRSLGDDFEQLGLLEVLNVLQTYDPNFGTSPVQYVSVAMRKRLYNCFHQLQSAYTDKAYPATNGTKGQSGVDAQFDLALFDREDAGDLTIDSDGKHSYSFEFSYSSVAANEDFDRFTSCDDGEFYRPEFQQSDLIDGVLQDVQNADQARQLMFAANQLPTRQREVVDLALQDYTDQEIATALQVSPQAVHKTKQKAIATMRSYMAGYMQ